MSPSRLVVAYHRLHPYMFTMIFRSVIYAAIFILSMIIGENLGNSYIINLSIFTIFSLGHEMAWYCCKTRAIWYLASVLGIIVMGLSLVYHSHQVQAQSGISPPKKITANFN